MNTLKHKIARDDILYSQNITIPLIYNISTDIVSINTCLNSFKLFITFMYTIIAKLSPAMFMSTSTSSS